MRPIGDRAKLVSADQILARIDLLARYSQANLLENSLQSSQENSHSQEKQQEPKLTRLFLSDAQRMASDKVVSWMREAGMTARIDPIGNVIGRYDPANSNGPCLILGSHLDTVRNAGKYDGPLGVLAAITCIEQLQREAIRLPFAIEVIGFADEEGVRFGSGLLGSRAVAGTFDSALLNLRDSSGVSLAEALREFGLDPDKIPSAAKRREEILAYVELHIEQGPVLEEAGLPVGCVSAINGAQRFKVDVIGKAGHAGTVPMTGRRDALAAAAECVLAVEGCCNRHGDGVVGTVGCLDVASAAINVIPAHASFSIDLRAPDNGKLDHAAQDILAAIDAIAIRRGIEINVVKLHDAAAAPCAAWLMDQIDAAIEQEGLRPMRVSSGAGHDGMAMIAIGDIGMIFLRCAGGVSHHPAESVTPQDVEIGAHVLMHFIRNFQPRVTSA